MVRNFIIERECLIPINWHLISVVLCVGRRQNESSYDVHWVTSLFGLIFPWDFCKDQPKSEVVFRLDSAKSLGDSPSLNFGLSDCTVQS